MGLPKAFTAVRLFVTQVLINWDRSYTSAKIALISGRQEKGVLGLEVTHQAGRPCHLPTLVRLFFHSLRFYVVTEVLMYARSLKGQVVSWSSITHCLDHAGLPGIKGFVTCKSIINVLTADYL